MHSLQPTCVPCGCGLRRPHTHTACVGLLASWCALLASASTAARSGAVVRVGIQSTSSSHQGQSTCSDRRVDAGRSNCEGSDRQHVAPQGLGVDGPTERQRGLWTDSCCYVTVQLPFAILYVYLHTCMTCILSTTYIAEFDPLTFSAFSAFCLQCFDAVGWAAGRASGL